MERDWEHDWQWTTQCTPYRAGMLLYNWRDQLHRLSDRTLLTIVGELDYGSIHMIRFKTLAKKEFLGRFVETHYPHLIDSPTGPIKAEN